MVEKVVGTKVPVSPKPTTPAEKKKDWTHNDLLIAQRAITKNVKFELQVQPQRKPVVSPSVTSNNIKREG